ncbi:MAG: hypothetical protein IJ666_05950 [Ruminococcus sp.]|nr:hypothetical protein [Ruminococcus sp.]
MIIEFNGLAGCGKSTLQQKLSEMSSDISYAGVAEFRGNGLSGLKKLFLKFRRFVCQYLPGNLKFYLLCRKLFSSAESNNNFSLRENRISIMYMVYLYETYRRCGDGILVSDEGFLQTLASIGAKGRLNPKAVGAVCRELKKINGGIFEINCKSDVDGAIIRIRERNRNDSAIDRLGGSELRDYLTEFDRQLRIFRRYFGKKYGHMYVDTSLPPEKSAQQIAERIHDFQ